MVGLGSFFASYLRRRPGGWAKECGKWPGMAEEEEEVPEIKEERLSETGLFYRAFAVPTLLSPSSQHKAAKLRLGPYSQLEDHHRGRRSSARRGRCFPFTS